MKYLKSEHLKFRRTFFNKLLIIAPLITAVFAWLMAGFTGFQYIRNMEITETINEW